MNLNLNEKVDDLIFLILIKIKFDLDNKNIFNKFIILIKKP